MLEYIDQMNCTIRLESSPRRIVSLVPSQTQLLHYLGLEEEVVGITKFCIHPEVWFRSKPRVGGTKAVNLEKVRELQPDLIIGNKEENQQEDIEALKEIAPVWMSDIFNLSDALEMINAIGDITNKSSETHKLSASIKENFSSLAESRSHLESLKPSKDVLYFIWHDPYMTAGSNTFIDDMLSRCGLNNLMTEERYPTASLKEQPDYVFLSSEPYPFKEKHLREYEELYPTAKVVLVDGEMFSWYGSKLKDAPQYFSQLLKGL